MHRTGACATERPPAVRVVGPEPLERVLRAGGRVGRESGADARIDEQYLETPFYGSRKMAETFGVNRKRVQRLMRVMGMEAIYPKPRLTQAQRRASHLPVFAAGCGGRAAGPGVVERHHVRADADGFMYLMAVIDWYSRYVLSWRLSNTLDGAFCLEALEEALSRRRPEIFNTDQGAQFTSLAFTGRSGAGGRGDQHGRPRPGDGQRVRRAAVADREVRGRLPEGVRDGAGVADGPCRITSTSTAISASTSRWTTARRPRCTGRRREAYRVPRPTLFRGLPADP